MIIQRNQYRGALVRLNGLGALSETTETAVFLGGEVLNIAVPLLLGLKVGNKSNSILAALLTSMATDFVMTKYVTPKIIKLIKDT